MQRLSNAAPFVSWTILNSRPGFQLSLAAALVCGLAACSEESGAPYDASPGAVLEAGAGGPEAGPAKPGVSDATIPGSPGAGPDASNAAPDAANPQPAASDAGVIDSGPSTSDSGPSPLPDAGGGPLTGPFPAVPDFIKNGSFPSTTLQNTGPNGGYTVYLPTMLGPSGLKHPIIGWMSGGGTTHDLYPLLPRLATHGFVIVAANVAPGIGDEANLGKQIIAGIDWAIAENAKSGSMLFGKLDTTKIASMGYSMGSLATFMIAGDPRLTTTVHISGGNMAPERISNLRAPAIFICGTPGPTSCGILDTSCDIAAANCDTDFAGATTPVFYANFGGGHLGVLVPPTEDQIGGLAAMWLRWKLMDDRSLDRKFLGDACEVCKETPMPWSKVQRKNL